MILVFSVVTSWTDAITEDVPSLFVLEYHQYITKAAYVVLGIWLDGYKDILGVWIVENESTKFGYL